MEVLNEKKETTGLSLHGCLTIDTFDYSLASNISIVRGIKCHNERWYRM
jgi:hypothetical protein